MGIDALTHDLAGNLVVPATSAQWDEWVSPSATRNHVLENPLLDWLNRYGEAHGFVRDPIDEPTDFLTFLFAKGHAFEAAVVEHLRGLAEVRTVLPEGATREERRDLAFAEATFAAMVEGVPIIGQGSLRDAETRTYGAPDLLVRSDVLARLFPGSLSDVEAAVPAPDLDIGNRHYRVVDIKFSTLHLAAGGELGNSGSAPAYKAQVFIYNRALGRLQGYLPPEAFVLGRGWEQTRRGDTTRVPDCMDRIAPVANDYASYGRGRLSDQVEQAVEWVRRVRREGRDWRVLPEPSVEELRPNAKVDAGEWSSAVKEIVKAGRGPDAALVGGRGEAARREPGGHHPLDGSARDAESARHRGAHDGAEAASAARREPRSRRPARTACARQRRAVGVVRGGARRVLRGLRDGERPGRRFLEHPEAGRPAAHLHDRLWAR